MVKKNKKRISDINLFIKKKSYLLKAFLVFSLVYLLFTSLSSVLSETIPFWFDPARDLLLAWENLEKPRLIGHPTGGLPGLFYGPYWIWLNSFALIFSKNPSFVAMLILTVPYFTIFPYILYKFTKFFKKDTFLLMWLLFILAYGNYVTHLWNSHLVPLLFLILVYNLIRSEPIDNKNYFRPLLAGIFCGLIINFHLSFGIGIFLASYLFLFWVNFLNLWRDKKKYKVYFFRLVSIVFLFTLGLLLTFLPFIVFEYRHGFNQTRLAWKAFTDAVFYNSATTGQTGLGNTEILQVFFGKFADILKIPRTTSYFIYLLIFGYAVYQIKQKKLHLDLVEKKLITFLLIASISIVFIYSTSKNPVWEHYFIGTEIIPLFLIWILINKFSLIRKALTFLVIYLILSSMISFIRSYKTNPFSIPSLATKKHITEIIYKDSNKKPFSIAAYSPHIYTYDYDYLFKWLGGEKYQHFPIPDISKTDAVYLIIPEVAEEIKNDFINYKTPDKIYRTENTWKIADGTVILKRIKK